MVLVMSQTRDGIIEDLYGLGVKVSEILRSNPRVDQLKEMRDKLMALHDAVKSFPVPQFSDNG